MLWTRIERQTLAGTLGKKLFANKKKKRQQQNIFLVSGIIRVGEGIFFEKILYVDVHTGKPLPSPRVGVTTSQFEGYTSHLLIYEEKQFWPIHI